MKENFFVHIESLHLADSGTENNALGLHSSQLHEREVIYIDIANDPILPQDYKETEDPKIFKSKITKRGPLAGPEWKKKCVPVMTCYKLITCEFKWFGLQTKVETFIQNAEQRILTNFHRQLFCWMDFWHGLTMEQIREIEAKTKNQLDEERKKGTVRGTQS